MSTFGIISLACLIITGTLSGWAIFSHHYDDTLLQRIGLSIVSIGCATRAYERIVSEVADPPPALLWSQIGLALFAIGSAWRIYMASVTSGHHRRRPRVRRGLPV